MDQVKAFIDLIRATFAEWNEDGAPRLAAALAYYTAFSLAPLIVIIVAVIGFVVSEDTVRNNIVQEISASVGSGAAEFVQDLINNVNQPREGIISTLLGIGALPASHPSNLGMMGMHGEAWVNAAIQEACEIAKESEMGRVREVLLFDLNQFWSAVSQFYGVAQSPQCS